MTFGQTPGYDPFMSSTSIGNMAGGMLGGQSPGAYGMGIGQQQPGPPYQPPAGVMPSGDPYEGFRFQQGPDAFGTVQPYGFDQTSPGVYEQAFQQMEPEIREGPRSSEQYWNGVAGQFSGPAYEQLAKRGEDQYNRVTGVAGEIRDGKRANLDPYYQRAQQDTSQAIDRAALGRGTFGNARTMDFQSDAAARLGAERANREGDYDLSRLAESRLWEGLGADIGKGSEQTRLDWLNSGMAGANALDQLRMQNMGMGLDAAQAAQSFQEGRGNRAFDEQLAMQSLMMPMMNGMYNRMIEEQGDYLSATMNPEIALGNENLNQDYRRSEGIKEDADWAKNFIFGLGGAGGAGGLFG